MTLREYATDISKRIESHDALDDFISWLDDADSGFAIVDIAEGSSTPMEMVFGDVVLGKYLEYLAGILAEIEMELSEGTTPAPSEEVTT
jgi:hypothetical protein